MHWLECELGRRDLARKGLQALLDRPNLLAIDRLAIEATLLHAGGRRTARICWTASPASTTSPMRARLLVLARPGCDAKAILPLLSATAATARDCGAMGLWLDLQLARLTSLRDAGRSAEAAQTALALWARPDQGLVGMGLFDHQASGIVVALPDSHASLVGTVPAVDLRLAGPCRIHFARAVARELRALARDDRRLAISPRTEAGSLENWLATRTVCTSNVQAWPPPAAPCCRRVACGW